MQSLTREEIQRSYHQRFWRLFINNLTVIPTWLLLLILLFPVCASLLTKEIVIWATSCAMGWILHSYCSAKKDQQLITTNLNNEDKHIRNMTQTLLKIEMELTK